MTDRLATPRTYAEDHAVWAQAVLRRQVALLETLAEAGLELAVAIKDRGVQAEALAENPNTAAMAFSRVARVVRMTALLQSRLIEQMGEADHRGAFARLQDNASLEDVAQRDPANAHKARVEAIVERVAMAAHGDDPDRLDRLVIEAGERLDDDDIYGDVLTRPVGELVALICRDLGLEPDWNRLAQEAWAQEEIASCAEGSPLASMLNHQEHQGHQEESLPEGADAQAFTARLGVLGVLGGSILFEKSECATHGASP